MSERRKDSSSTVVSATVLCNKCLTAEVLEDKRKDQGAVRRSAHAKGCLVGQGASSQKRMKGLIGEVVMWVTAGNESEPTTYLLPSGARFRPEK